MEIDLCEQVPTARYMMPVEAARLVALWRASVVAWDRPWPWAVSVTSRKRLRVKSRRCRRPQGADVSVVDAHA